MYAKRTDQQGSISDKRPSGSRPKRLTAKMAQPPILIGACPTFPFPLQKKMKTEHYEKTIV
jgi:hypothetical protein